MTIGENNIFVYGELFFWVKEAAAAGGTPGKVGVGWKGNCGRDGDGRNGKGCCSEGIGGVMEEGCRKGFTGS